MSRTREARLLRRIWALTWAVPLHAHLCPRACCSRYSLDGCLATRARTQLATPLGALAKRIYAGHAAAGNGARDFSSIMEALRESSTEDGDDLAMPRME